MPGHVRLGFAPVTSILVPFGSHSSTCLAKFWELLAHVGAPGAPLGATLDPFGRQCGKTPTLNKQTPNLSWYRAHFWVFEKHVLKMPADSERGDLL